MFAPTSSLLSSHKCYQPLKFLSSVKRLSSGHKVNPVWWMEKRFPETCYKHCIVTRAARKCTQWEINHILCEQTSALYLGDLLQKLQHCAAAVGILTAPFSTTHEFKEDEVQYILECHQKFSLQTKSVTHFLQETQYASIPCLLPSVVKWKDKTTVQCWWQCTKEIKYGWRQYWLYFGTNMAFSLSYWTKVKQWLNKQLQNTVETEGNNLVCPWTEWPIFTQVISQRNC